jgi:high-affinity Fe2+/Pb2+ permease
VTDELVAKVAAMACLTVIIVAGIIGMTVVAVTTDRNLVRAETFTFATVLFVAVLGGLSVWSLRRHHRWRFEREELPNRNHVGSAEPEGLAPSAGPAPSTAPLPPRAGT